MAQRKAEGDPARNAAVAAKGTFASLCWRNIGVEGQALPRLHSYETTSDYRGRFWNIPAEGLRLRTLHQAGFFLYISPVN